MDISIEQKQIVINNLLLTYYHANPQTKRRGAVLFLHGWGSNSTLWFQSSQALFNQGYELFFLDLPGFGKSQNPEDAFFMQDYSYHVLTFIEKLQLRDVHLVGHSFGGKTAIKLASENAEFLKSIVLVDSSGIPHKTTESEVKVRMAKMIKPVFSFSFMYPLKEKLLQKFASEDYMLNPALKQTFINVVNEDMRPYLKHIAKPTLILWGKQDENSYTPIADAYILNKEIKGSEIGVIDNAGHYSFLDQPKIFTDYLLTFFNHHD